MKPSPGPFPEILEKWRGLTEPHWRDAAILSQWGHLQLDFVVEEEVQDVPLG